MGATKEMYGQLMSRVEMPYSLYKDLKDTWEYQEFLELKKVFDPSHKELFKQSKKWKENTEMLKEVMKDREEIESQIRVYNMIECSRCNELESEDLVHFNGLCEPCNDDMNG